MHLACQSGVWSRPDTPGQYAFFNAASCPAGWIAANGANGTVDLRGEFIRGWDNERGADPGRALASWQMDAIRNISGSFSGVSGSANNAYSWGFAPGLNGAFNVNYNGGTYNRYGGAYGAANGSTVTFDASRIVPTAPENRPRNVALLACMKL